MSIINRFNLIPLGLVLIVFCQNPPWFILPVGNMAGYLIVFILLIYLCLLQKKFILLQIDSFKFCSLLISLIFLFIFPSINGEVHLSSLFVFLTFMLLFQIDTNTLSKAFEILTKTLAWIILLSLPLWLIHVFFVRLPEWGTLDFSSFKGSYYVMKNYIFFIVNEETSTYESFRFYSVFDEPGTLGTLSAFILLGNRYNFSKWYNVAILLGGIFTYSMAFYILSFMGFVFMKFRSLKKIFLSMTILLLVVTFTSYLLKDNIAFQRSVITRFENTEENGVDSRTSIEVSKHFENMIEKQNLYTYIGEGNTFLLNTIDKNGSSYKLFVIEYGILGCLSLLLLYSTLLKKKNRNTLFFFFMFFISFLQRPVAMSAWQPVIFAMCIATYILPHSISSFKERL